MASMTTQGDVIHVAIELSQSSWLVAARLPDAKKPYLFRIAGGEFSALLKLLFSLRMRFAAKTRRSAKIICSFAAGRDGFWLHRPLIGHAIESYVLEPTSILVNRRARRAKRTAWHRGHATRLGHLSSGRSQSLQHDARANGGRGGCQATAS